MAKLSARAIAGLSKPGHYVDGEGLGLVIGRKGGKSWVLRTVVNGKRRDIGLGGLAWVSLAEAREKARALRKIAREGGDPIQLRMRQETCPTFEEAAKKVHLEQVVGQAGNKKHHEQWINTLATYAFPFIGPKPIREVTQADVLRVLSPIWTEKAETARRVRQRVRTVMSWARTAGHFEGVNPVEGVEKGLARQRDRVQHHAAMPWKDIPAFFSRIGGSISAEALRFLILTASRTKEVIDAQWSEIDIENALWTIPAERMKARREHRVPLTPATIEILQRVKGIDPKIVFPGPRGRYGLSNMTMALLLRRKSTGKFTVHGFRSSFRDWAAERSNMPREIAEMCLAHNVGTEVERAYLRSDLVQQRRSIMERWSSYCISGEAPHAIRLVS